MATLLKKFSARWMRNKEHLGFMSIISKLFPLLTINEIEKAKKIFLEKLAVEEAAFTHQRKSQKTALIVKFNSARNRAWRSLQLLSMSEALDEDPEIAKAGTALVNLMKSYGDPRELPYTQADGVFQNLGENLIVEPYATYVTVLNADRKVKAMINNHNAFLKAYSERNSEQATVKAGIAREVRQEMDTSWASFVNIINGYVFLYGDEDVAQFITEVNQEIANQRTVKLNRANLRAKKKKDEEKGKEEGEGREAGRIDN